LTAKRNVTCTSSLAIAGNAPQNRTKPENPMTNLKNSSRLSPATRAAQAMHALDPATGAVVPSLDMSTTFARDADYDLRQGYVYGRYGGPTTRQAETVLAALDESAGTLLFASGMAGFVALFETLDTGAHVVLPEVMYHGGLEWVRRLQEKRGLRVSLFDAGTDGALEQAVLPDTKLVWVESPTNPVWQVIDIARAAECAHAVGALLAVDSTVAPPCTTRALELGADISFQSATKYLNGHSDLTGGVLSFALNGPLFDEVTLVRKMQGAIMAPFEAWLLVRGIRTLYLRFERCSQNALAIAKHFHGHPLVDQVLYPGLPSHPGHEIAAHQMSDGFGGMLSLLVKGGEQAALDTARFTEVFFPATSLGGVESLIEHRKTVEGPHSLVAPNLLRLSVGIEALEDLQADLEQALERAHATP